MDIHKNKAARRLRRKRHIRRTLSGTPARPRLSVTRSLKHFYCQLIDDTRGVTVACASSLSKELRDQIGVNTGNRRGAEMVGNLLAQRAKELGITKVCFDRNGYKYHGRLAALADAVRKQGIEV
ncbi:MAG: 50S ribosomal protein L18 [Planctomycetota bacterium]